MTNPLLSAAQDYISLGLTVLALTGKMPNGRVHPHWKEDAFAQGCRLDKLVAAFKHPATTGVGVVCKFPLVVVDIDGEEGALAWRDIAGEDYIPDRWVARSSRGLHLYTASWEPVGTSKMAPLLDLKGEGGYVAAPPSLHPSGHVYEWLAEPEGSLLEAPPGLVKYIHDLNFDRQRHLLKATASKRVRHEQLEGGKIWPTWSFDGLYDGMSNAADGDRNNYLHWAAKIMVEDGAADEEFEDLAERALKAGLTSLEVRRTIRSARRSGG